MTGESGNAAVALAARIEGIRREQNLTVEELVDRAEIDRSILRALAGGADIGILSIVRIAGTLGVGVDQLFADLRSEDAERD